MSNLIERAAAFATDAHRSQKWASEPYIVHPKRVAEAVAAYGGDDTAVAAAWLHDVVEDCGVSLEELCVFFNDDVADAVDSVTRRYGETYAELVKRSALHSRGRVIKLMDVRDKMSVDHHFRPSLRKRYGRALLILGG